VHAVDICVFYTQISHGKKKSMVKHGKISTDIPNLFTEQEEG
jgi:hypothetical protein